MEKMKQAAKKPLNTAFMFRYYSLFMKKFAILADLKDHEQMIKEIEKIREELPEFKEARTFKVLLLSYEIEPYYQKQDYEKAIALCDKFLKEARLDPNLLKQKIDIVSDT